jgi:hypothetical protein
MFTGLGIVYGDGRPRINATLAEVMDMDIRLFLRIHDQLGDDFAAWATAQKKRGGLGI